MIALAVSHAQPADLHNNENRTWMFASHQLLDNFDRHGAEAGERRYQLLILSSICQLTDGCFIKRRARARDRWELRSPIRRFVQHMAEQVRRKIRPRSHLLRQYDVVFSAFHQAEEAVVSEARAAVFRNAAQDLASAAANQQFAHRLRDVGAPRNREQMRLTLLRGDINEIVVSELRRSFEDRAGDFDRVVACQQSYHANGRVIERREAIREFAPRLEIGIHQEPTKHLIKQSDMIGVEIVAREEKAADASDHSGPARGRTVMDSPFQFADEPSRRRHVRVPIDRSAHARGAHKTKGN